MLTLYLAGPVRGPGALWRRAFGAALGLQFGGLCDPGDILLISPGRNITGATTKAEAEAAVHLYVPGDILSLRRADALVAYLRAESGGRGTSWELGYASARGLPIFAIAPEPADRVSWVFALGNLAVSYPGIAEAAQAVAHAAGQLSGKAQYDPTREG